MSNRKGFTLIELLIVVVIIGILAAIAIPKFANTKEKAYIAAMKSDLRNLVTAEEGYFSDNQDYTSTLGANQVNGTGGGGHGGFVPSARQRARRDPAERGRVAATATNATLRRHQDLRDLRRLGRRPGRRGDRRRRAGLQLTRLTKGRCVTRTARLTPKEKAMSNRKGFTLIELLIVVVIIGILAAIAIPKFANTKEKAYMAAMKSDLRNLVTAEEAFFSDNQDYTGTLGANQVNGTGGAGTVAFVPSAQQRGRGDPAVARAGGRLPRPTRP